MPSTLFEALAVHKASSKPAIIIPGGPQLTYPQYFAAIRGLQLKLAQLGLPEHAAISIAIPNTIEFAVAFLGVALSSFIAAPLNSNYKKSEFAFYIEDLKSALLLVPKGSVEKNTPAVQAARDFNTAIAEIYWDNSINGLAFDLKDVGALKKPTTQQGLPAPPKPETVALVLHTSGTTGRPLRTGRAGRRCEHAHMLTCRSLGGTYFGSG